MGGGIYDTGGGYNRHTGGAVEFRHTSRCCHPVSLGVLYAQVRMLDIVSDYMPSLLTPPHPSSPLLRCACWTSSRTICACAASSTRGWTAPRQPRRATMPWSSSTAPSRRTLHSFCQPGGIAAGRGGEGRGRERGGRGGRRGGTTPPCHGVQPSRLCLPAVNQVR